MQELLNQLPGGTLEIFLSSLVVILATIFAWIGRKIGKFLEKNTQIKMTETHYKIIDGVALWAANTTEQAFRKYILPADKTLEEKNKEKIDYAVAQARAHLPTLLPAEEAANITDEQLRNVIESKVAQTKNVLVPAGSTITPSVRPPSFSDTPETTFQEVPTRAFNPFNK